jgi:hypothetical protein
VRKFPTAVEWPGSSDGKADDEDSPALGGVDADILLAEVSRFSEKK